MRLAGDNPSTRRVAPFVSSIWLNSCSFLVLIDHQRLAQRQYRGRDCAVPDHGERRWPCAIGLTFCCLLSEKFRQRNMDRGAEVNIEDATVTVYEWFTVNSGERLALSTHFQAYVLLVRVMHMMVPLSGVKKYSRNCNRWGYI